MQGFKNQIRIAFLLSCIITLAGCGSGGGGKSNTPSPTYSVSGTISGLNGSGLVLQLNGASDLSVSANGNISFSQQLSNSTSYAVTVMTGPMQPLQTCTVVDGSGTINSSDVTDVMINCVDEEFQVGGEVTGLEGTQLILSLQTGSEITVDSDGSFIFPDYLAPNATYFVSVDTQPSNPSQSCTLNNRRGSIQDTNVMSVEVQCSEIQQILYQQTSGLNQNTDLHLIDELGENPIPIATTMFNEYWAPGSVSSKGRIVYMRDAEDISPEEIEIISILPDGTNPISLTSAPRVIAPALDSSGSVYLISDSGGTNKNVAVVDDIGTNFRIIANSPDDEELIAVTPLNRAIYSFNGNLYSYFPAGGSPLPLTATGDITNVHAVTSDDRIIFTRINAVAGTEEIGSVKSDGTELITLDSSNEDIYFHLLTRSNQVFYTKGGSGKYALYGAKVDGTNQILFTTNHFPDSKPLELNDGRIAHISGDIQNSKIVVTNPNGGNAIELLESGATKYLFSALQDDRMLVIERGTTNNYKLLIVNFNATEIVTLAQDVQLEYLERFFQNLDITPNGKIYYQAYSTLGGGNVIYSVDIDGNSTTALTQLDQLSRLVAITRSGLAIYQEKDDIYAVDSLGNTTTVIAQSGEDSVFLGFLDEERITGFSDYFAK